MRRNVRRLNREIGHHASSLSNYTAVIPLSAPSSYQPRSKASEKRNSTNNMALGYTGSMLDYNDNNSQQTTAAYLASVSAAAQNNNTFASPESSFNNTSLTGTSAAIAGTNSNTGYSRVGSFYKKSKMSGDSASLMDVTMDGLMQQQQQLQQPSNGNGNSGKKKGVRKAVNLSGNKKMLCITLCWTCDSN